LRGDTQDAIVRLHLEVLLIREVLIVLGLVSFKQPEFFARAAENSTITDETR
jgi:hypothetical protein